MTIDSYPADQVAAQPAGYWTSIAAEHILGGIRAALAEEGLAQPHWWILGHVRNDPGVYSRPSITAKLSPYDIQDHDFEQVLADLIDERGWLSEIDGVLSLTDEGAAGWRRAADRTGKIHAKMHAGVTPTDYVTAVNVLRTMVANLGGRTDLPS